MPRSDSSPDGKQRRTGLSQSSPSGDGSARGTNSVVDILREKVISGYYGGDLLREEEVAADLGLSRTPVREGIQALVAEGLLLKEHSRSARVFRPSLEDLADIYSIRTPLEGLAARSAAELGGPQLAKELNVLLEKLASAEPGLDYSLRHEEFHAHIVGARSTSRLAAIIRTLRAQSEPYVRFALQASPDFLKNATRGHGQIVEAIRAGNGALAEKLVSEHLRESMERIPRILSLGSSMPGLSNPRPLVAPPKRSGRSN